MRPRGESISTPSARYVGQASRQSPQRTHCLSTLRSSSIGTAGTALPRSAGACSWMAMLSSFSVAILLLQVPDEAARVERPPRIELFLEGAHDREAVPRVAPDIQTALGPGRARFDH